MTDEALAEERRLFEAAMRPLYPIWSFASDGCGGYHAMYTDIAWEAWQARALLAQAAQPTEALALQMLVAAGHVTQAKVDEALRLARPLAAPPKDKGSQDQ